MADPVFTPTLQEQIALSFAYLANLGNNLETPSSGYSSIEEEILALLQQDIPKVSVLQNQDQADWQVVWGPTTFRFDFTKFTDNVMYVVQQISIPSNYIVAIRGTNPFAIADFFAEDLAVFSKEIWQVPEGKTVSGSPKISKATETGLDALLNKMVPPENVPATGKTITDFLTSIVSEKVNITFTGHSLGGTLSPVLALWFKQSQGLSNSWDPNSNAAISAIPFAGLTAGNTDFANYFNSELGTQTDRVFNTIDLIPHFWETDTLETVKDLYEPELSMPNVEKILVDALILTVKDYQQIATANSFTWQVNTAKADTYNAQAGFQHVFSYPDVLGVPELIDLVLPYLFKS